MVLNGQAAVDFNVELTPEMAISCDIDTEYGRLTIRHHIEIDVTVTADATPLDPSCPGDRPNQQTRMEHILRMRKPVVITSCHGNGMDWIEQAPPRYENVSKPPPKYLMSVEDCPM